MPPSSPRPWRCPRRPALVLVLAPGAPPLPGPAGTSPLHAAWPRVGTASSWPCPRCSLVPCPISHQFHPLGSLAWEPGSAAPRLCPEQPPTWAPSGRRAGPALSRPCRPSSSGPGQRTPGHQLRVAMWSWTCPFCVSVAEGQPRAAPYTSSGGTCTQQGYSRWGPHAGGQPSQSRAARGDREIAGARVGSGPGPPPPTALGRSLSASLGEKLGSGPEGGPARPARL